MAWLVVGYAVYWAVTGLAFAALVASLYPWPRPTSPGGGRLRRRLRRRLPRPPHPAGLGVREGVLVVALAPVLPAGPALVVALSRVWMMLVELAGAGLAHLAARHRALV